MSVSKAGWVEVNGKTTGLSKSATVVSEHTETSESQLAEPGGKSQPNSRPSKAANTSPASWATPSWPRKPGSANPHGSWAARRATYIPRGRRRKTLFPFTKADVAEPYIVYAGDCTANNPETVTAAGENLKPREAKVTPNATVTVTEPRRRAGRQSRSLRRDERCQKTCRHRARVCRDHQQGMRKPESAANRRGGGIQAQSQTRRRQRRTHRRNRPPAVRQKTRILRTGQVVETGKFDYRYKVAFENKVKAGITLAPIYLKENRRKRRNRSRHCSHVPDDPPLPPTDPSRRARRHPDGDAGSDPHLGRRARSAAGDARIHDHPGVKHRRPYQLQPGRAPDDGQGRPGAAVELRGLRCDRHPGPKAQPRRARSNRSGRPTSGSSASTGRRTRSGRSHERQPARHQLDRNREKQHRRKTRQAHRLRLSKRRRRIAELGVPDAQHDHGESDHPRRQRDPSGKNRWFIFRTTSTKATAPSKKCPGAEAETAASKAQIAKVEIHFTQAAENGDTNVGRTTSVSDSVVLRFNSAGPRPESGTAPCA